MGFLAKLLGKGTVKTALEGTKDVLGAIDGLSTSAEEKKQLRAHVITSVVDAQSKVIEAEYEHGNWLSRSWRPCVMLSFAAILIYTFFLGPLFGLTVVAIPAELWTLLQVGISGFVGGRSLEKITDKLTTAKELRKMAKLKDKLDGSD